jgi:hypothetical protein
MNIQRVLWTGPDWSEESIEFVGKQVTELLAKDFGVSIAVPRETIVNILNSQLQHFRPRTGDIFTRYNLENTIPDGTYDSLDLMKSTIDIIVAAVSGDLQQDSSNKDFSIWNSVNGGPLGMQFHPQVRLNNRRPKPRFNVRF